MSRSNAQIALEAAATVTAHCVGPSHYTHTVTTRVLDAADRFKEWLDDNTEAPE